MFPGSTRRRPTRPSMGEVMWQYVRFNFAEAIISLVDFHGTLVLKDGCPLRGFDLLRHGILGDQGW